jgi:uncharacterized ferritin-like protein (DUF455 family)
MQQAIDLPLPEGEGVLMQTVAQAISAVLNTSDPRAKVMAARRTARDWRLGRVAHEFDAVMPDRPARPVKPELLPASRMPKRGRAGSERARIAMLHALAHIEFSAIDLAFDLAGRFGADKPRSFIDDWLSVGADEALHFALLERRLRSLGAAYGNLPAHDGLWEAAEATAGDALARIAIVPMVLEARGLDVTPATVARFRGAGDLRSANILERIYKDEIRHVAHGVKWFESLSKVNGGETVTIWHSLVKTHFRGELKPPFNDSAREAAGLTKEFYAALAV